MTTTRTCASCKKTCGPGTGDAGGAIGRTEFCTACYTRASKKRLDRAELKASRADILQRRYQEMRDAIAARDRYRREANAERDRIRESVWAEVMDGIRRLSAWQRLRLVFDPFGRGTP